MGPRALKLYFGGLAVLLLLLVAFLWRPAVVIGVDRDDLESSVREELSASYGVDCERTGPDSDRWSCGGAENLSGRSTGIGFELETGWDGCWRSLGPPPQLTGCITLLDAPLS